GGTDSDVGWSVRQTEDCGFIIAGETNSFGAGTPTSPNVYLIRTNSSGNALWTNTYGGTDYDVGYSVQQTSDSGFIIAGTIGPAANIYLIKINSSGDTLWTKTFGGTDGDCGHSVQQTQDGGFIILGRTSSFGAGNNDVYLIRTDSSGDTLWTKTFGGTDSDVGWSVRQTEDCGFIIAGETNSFGAGVSDVYLIRTDFSGDTLWTKTFGGTGSEEGYLVQQTSDSGFIIVGRTSSFGAGNSDVYLIKTNSSGDTLWTKTFGGTKYDLGYSVQQTSDGGFNITGQTESFGAGSGDVYLIRLDKETGVEEQSNLDFGFGNAELKIGQNPITNFATISYAIPSQCEVKLNLYDITGKLVDKIVNKAQPAGFYAVKWSFSNGTKKISSGVYFITLSVGKHKETQKLTIIR
ncbi:MAG: T9SS type A sorting domain-containing protein, partial [bacterium]|nr:T9SS type A sorting domain-containing protein [bacterium]